MVSRGYAVAHFSLRGTSGFGQRFLKAGNFQFADQIPRDLEAGLRFLADSGWIDAKRVAILGSGHGGLLAMRLAANSASYRGVIAINAPASVDIEELHSLYAVNAPETLDIKMLRSWYGYSDSWKGSLRSSDRRSMYIDATTTPELISRAGGPEAATQLTKRFAAESIVPQLSVPAFLIYSDFADGDVSEKHPAAMRSYFRRNHKAYEWYEVDYQSNRKLAIDVSEQRLWDKVADFLDRTLK